MLTGRLSGAAVVVSIWRPGASAASSHVEALDPASGPPGLAPFLGSPVSPRGHCAVPELLLSWLCAFEKRFSSTTRRQMAWYLPVSGV